MLGVNVLPPRPRSRRAASSRRCSRRSSISAAGVRAHSGLRPTRFVETLAPFERAMLDDMLSYSIVGRAIRCAMALQPLSRERERTS